MTDVSTERPERSANVRDAAIEAATRLFARHGFDGTSLQAIADEVGVRKPSLLYHFASKDALRQAVLDRLIAHWNALLPKVLLLAAREDRFGATVESLADFFFEDPNRARLLLREALDRPDEMKVRLETQVRPWIRVVAQQLEAARESGYVRPDVDVGAYAVQVMHFIVSAVAMQTTTESALPDGRGGVDRWRTEMLRMVRAALFQKPIEGRRE